MLSTQFRASDYFCWLIKAKFRCWNCWLNHFLIKIVNFFNIFDVFVIISGDTNFPTKILVVIIFDKMNPFINKVSYLIDFLQLKNFLEPLINKFCICLKSMDRFGHKFCIVIQDRWTMFYLTSTIQNRAQKCQPFFHFHYLSKKFNHSIIFRKKSLIFCYDVAG